MAKGLQTTARPDLIEDGASPSPERGNAIDQTHDLHPEVLAFARWFAEWLLRRGCSLVAAAEGRKDSKAA
jgi:hypothetical protein